MTYSTRFLAPLALAGALLSPMAAPAQTTDTVLTPRTFIEVSKKALPSVVSIDVRVLPSQELLDENKVSSLEELLEQMMRNGGRMSQERLWEEFNRGGLGSSGAGSGVIIHEDDRFAYVLTNNHVLETGERIRYTIKLDESLGGQEVSGDAVEVVGVDTLTDLAVLRFPLPEGVDLPVMEFADSDKVEVGEWVLALGNPLELNNSVSQGIVSAKGRRIGKAVIENLLQTTATINPGNSGGPLVNLDGEIVGINNAIATSTGRWAGVGFAIPGNQARRISEMLIEQGRVTRGYLGIQMEPLRPSVARTFDMEGDSGVLILDVKEGTPAREAGLQMGDILTHVDGQRIRETADVLNIIGNKLAGESIEVKVTRFKGNEREDFAREVLLMERPSEELLRDGLIRPRTLQEEQAGDAIEESGLRVYNFFDKDSAPAGVMVSSVEEGSPAERAGLAVGDLIVQLNGFKITNEQDLREALALERREGAGHVGIFRRDGSPRHFTMDKPE